MKEFKNWKLLRVNLEERRTDIQEIGTEDLRLYMGGSGIGAKILYEETSAGTDPLGPENPLIFMTGLFTGSLVPLSGRHSVVSKSPLTGIYGESDVGGSWGNALKRAGYDGVMVIGQSEEPVYLVLAEDKAEIRSAKDLWGKDSHETDRIIKQEFGQKAVISCIGQAGERLVRISSIISDAEHGRAAGRCGLGAVMGSKKLKAIAILAEKGGQQPADDSLKESIRSIIPVIKEKGKLLREFGTSGQVAAAEAIGDLPIKNWQWGSWKEGAAKLSGQAMAESILSGRYSCSGCIIGCGRVVSTPDAPYGSVKGGGPEYENLAAVGSMCLVDDLFAVAKANELCNRYGIDSISAGNIIAFAMEAYEKGLLTKGDLDGIDLTWGNPGAMLGLLRKLGHREGIGELLSSGTRQSARHIARGAEQFAIHVKGLEFAMHDPRAFSSLAVGYATSRIGASHWAMTHSLEARMALPDLGYDTVLDRFESKGKGILTAKMQDYMEMFEALKLCKFISWTPLRNMLDWIYYLTHLKLEPREFMEIGERISTLKRMYNVRCGITRKEDTLPERILTQKRGAGAASDYLPDLNAMLEEYYPYRGWNERGIPKREKLEALQLEKLINDLPPCGATVS
jgi:aldehyde:ferredoxin oxidoreductase